MSEIERCSYDTDDQFDGAVSFITKEFHLDEGLAQIATEWARDAWNYVGQVPEEEWSKELIDEALNLTLPGLDIPHGETENRPLFRVLYSAREALIHMASDRKELLQKAYYGDKQRFIPDFQQIDNVVTTLLDSFSNQLWPYNNDKTRVPQDPRHVPRRPEFQKTAEGRTEEDSIKLASFWFADCYYMRGVNNSIDMTINLAALYEDHPEIFDFKIAMTMEPEVIEELLLQYHLAVQHKAISEYWVENAKRMVDRYDGDPRKIFENYKDFDELCERICNDKKGGGFQGFQKKMASMDGYYLMYLKLVPYRNIPLPTDFHVVRTAIEQEMVGIDNMPVSGEVDFEGLKDFLREVFFDISEHTGIRQLDICDVIWLYSSNACVHSPTNRQTLIERIKDEKGKTLAWVYNERLVDADAATPDQRKAYTDSCALCRLEPTCKHDVPSREYYDRGIVRYPNLKPHLEIIQSSLHDEQTLLNAQPPVRPGTVEHEVAARATRRAEKLGQRLALIRKLAHGVVIQLTEEQKAKIAGETVTANGDPGASLTGRSYAFTANEVILALENRPPTPEEMEGLAPYMARVA